MVDVLDSLLYTDGHVSAYIIFSFLGFGLFILIKFIDSIDNYNHLLFFDRPMTCKKCHVRFSFVGSCVHSKHSFFIILLSSSFAVILFSASYYVVVPYFDSLPDYAVIINDEKPKDITWFTILNETKNRIEVLLNGY